MSKYAPLWEHIHKSACRELTFDQVEAILGFPLESQLPHS